MESADRLLVAPIGIYQAVRAAMRHYKISRRDAQEIVDRFLRVAGAQIISLTQDIGLLALEAFERYGKGAAIACSSTWVTVLRMRCAKWLGVRLLYKGDDFVHTDLA